MSNTPNPNPNELEAKILSYEQFKAEHGSGLTKEAFANVANFIPPTRSVFPGFATGFVQGGNIGTTLAPEIVAAPSGTEVASYPVFNKESFFSGEDDTVAINSGRKTADFSVTWATATLDAHAMDAPVDVRLQRALAAAGIDASLSALDLARNQVENHKEKAIATLLRAAGSYTNATQKRTLSGATQWSISTGVPMTDIFNAVEVVRGFCGMRPNYLWLSPRAFQALRTNPQITAQFKYGSSPSLAPPTVDALQGLFGLNIIVGDNLNSGTLNGAFSDTWGTDAGLACVGSGNLASPKFAATFTGAGSPLVMPAYLDRRFGAEGSMVYSYVDYYKPIITMPTAGFLFTTAAA